MAWDVSDTVSIFTHREFTFTVLTKGIHRHSPNNKEFTFTVLAITTK